MFENIVGDGDSIWSTILKAGGELGQKGIDYKESKDKEKADSATVKKQADAAIAADNAAMSANVIVALYQEMVDADAKDTVSAAKLDAAKNSAKTAVAAQDKAAVGMVDAAQVKRLEAATKTMNDLTKQSLDAAVAAASAKGDKAKQTTAKDLARKAKAASDLVDHISAGAAPGVTAAVEKSMGTSGGESIFTKKIAGVPVWGLGLAALVGGYFLLRKKK